MVREALGPRTVLSNYSRNTIWNISSNGLLGNATWKQVTWKSFRMMTSFGAEMVFATTRSSPAAECWRHAKEDAVSAMKRRRSRVRMGSASGGAWFVVAFVVCLQLHQNWVPRGALFEEQSGRRKGWEKVQGRRSIFVMRICLILLLGNSYSEWGNPCSYAEGMRWFGWLRR